MAGLIAVSSRRLFSLSASELCWRRFRMQGRAQPTRVLDAAFEFRAGGDVEITNCTNS